jgi:hypothetical protein
MLIGNGEGSILVARHVHGRIIMYLEPGLTHKPFASSDVSSA